MMIGNATGHCCICQSLVACLCRDCDHRLMCIDQPKPQQCRYYLVASALTGLFQATGWPCVVAVMAHWYGKGKRGLVMGIWSANTSVGNIVGSLVAAQALTFGVGWSFVAPGLLLSATSVLVFLFLIVHPSALPVADSHQVSRRRTVARSWPSPGRPAVGCAPW
jgi:MFS family permease